jgi:hypothetical protein
MDLPFTHALYPPGGEPREEPHRLCTGSQPESGDSGVEVVLLCHHGRGQRPLALVLLPFSF